MSTEKQIDDMKKRILEKYERLSIEDKFTFKCEPGISCFTKCCGDVNIFLTPYDVLRLKKRLGITSGEFIDKYTIMPFTKDQQLPVLLLKMDESNDKRCFFVGEQGCTVYEDRPWPCRMYPIGKAQAESADGKSGEEFYFIMAEDLCEGVGQGKEWSIHEWITNQGVLDYDEFGEYFKKLTLHPFFQKGGELPPEKIEMYFMSLYDLDKFREFLFESGFFKRFEVEDWLIEKLKVSDSELLRFGYQWIFFALFGEPTLKIRDDVLAKAKKTQEETQEAQEREKK